MISELFLKILNNEVLLEEEKAIYPTPDHFLKVLLLYSDESFAQNEGEVSGTLKDRVFEVILQRFETWLSVRPYLKTMDQPSLLGPVQLLNARLALCDFLNLTQKHIGLDFPESGKLALLGIFIKLYPVFLEDESRDLSKLMAELDDILDSLKPFVNFFLL